MSRESVRMLCAQHADRGALGAPKPGGEPSTPAGAPKGNPLAFSPLARALDGATEDDVFGALLDLRRVGRMQPATDAILGALGLFLADVANESDASLADLDVHPSPGPADAAAKANPSPKEIR